MSRFDPAVTLHGGALIVFALVATACTATGGTRGGGDPDMITRDQILAVPEGTAYTVVQRYKSAWLRARSQGFGTAQPDYARVYVDEMLHGDIDTLRGISTTQIESIEYINPLDATTRYGTGYAGGIIRVHTLGR